MSSAEEGSLHGGRATMRAPDEGAAAAARSAASSADEDSVHSGRAFFSSPIRIPGDDHDDDEEPLEQDPPSWYAASPGAHSYVSGPDSWRPVPPPMLASSLEKRFHPHLRPRPPPAPPPVAPPLAPPAYGALDVFRAAEPAAPPAAAAGRKPTRVPPRRARRASAGRPPPHPDTDTRTRGRSAIRRRLDKALEHLRSLDEAPRELWLIFGLKFLSSYAYFSLSIILTTFLTDEFGMSDTAAGWAYGAYGVMSTFFGLMCGWFIDYMGVRASLLVGALVGAFSRFVMALAVSKGTALFMLYTLLPFAECLGIPIMTIGIKRYTNARNRTFAFSLFYSMMNVAALCAGPLVDLSRSTFGDGFTVHIDPLGLDVRFTGLRLIILTSSVATAAMCIIVAIGIREIQVDESGSIREFIPNRESPMQQTMTVLREPAFWRLTVFTVLLVGVRLVFRHIDATMPKYMVRQFGPSAPFGLIYAINPFLIIFLVPIVGLVARKIDSFSMILAGSFVSAVSPFWLCFKQTYFSMVLFMVTLSIGEAVYSPRVYDYTMAVSAEGAEGLYSSLSSAPLFSVKLVVGGMSGWLLTSFMPADGPHHGNILWGIIGLTSLTSPILMFLLRDYISPPSEQGNRPRPDAENASDHLKSDRQEDRTDAIRSLKMESTPVHIDEDEDEDEDEGDQGYDNDYENFSNSASASSLPQERQAFLSSNPQQYTMPSTHDLKEVDITSAVSPARDSKD